MQGRGQTPRGARQLCQAHSPSATLPTWSALCSFQDLKTVLSLPQHPGELLHPVVYACTAVMLLCLLASVITYIVHQK